MFPDADCAIRLACNARLTHVGDIVCRQTSDRTKAVEWVKEAARRRVPLLIRGLGEGTDIRQVLAAARGVQVYPDASGGTSVPLQTFCRQGRGIATLMTAHHAGAVFEDRAFEAFRRRIGHAALQDLGDRCFGQARRDSQNLVVTGSAGELVSDAHQDLVHNLSVVVCGRKVWCIARMDESLFDQICVKSNRIVDGLGFDAYHVLDDPNPLFGCCFQRIVTEPGDVLYNPIQGVHQVNSVPNTVALSLFYKASRQCVHGVRTTGHGLSAPKAPALRKAA